MKIELTKEAIEKALLDGVKSMSELYRALGGKSKVSSSFSSKIRAFCPNVDARLLANKDQASVATEMPAPAKSSIPAATPAAKPTKPAATPKKQPKTKAKQPKPAKPVKVQSSKYPRHPQNPYHPGSSYGTAFDILATKKDGISRDELTNLLSKEMGKPVKNCSYDLSVVLSPTESFTGTRHKSARDGYFLRRENSHFTLMLPSFPPKN